MILSKLTVVPTVGMITGTLAIISDTVWLALISAVATLVSTVVLAFIQMRTRAVVDAVVTKVDTAVTKVDDVAKEAVAVAKEQGEKQAEIYTKVDGNLSNVHAQLKASNERVVALQDMVSQLVEKKTTAIEAKPEAVPQIEIHAETLENIELHTKQTAENTAKTQTDMETIKDQTK